MPGELPKDTLVNILKALPLDVTYIDECDVIRYYNDYRIFKRTPDILGTPCRTATNRRTALR